MSGGADLVHAAQLLEDANKMLPLELARKVRAVLNSMAPPTMPEQAAVVEAACRFVALVTGERPEVPR